jgi:hypothetical protein
MNSIDKWLTTATIHDEPRRSLWSVVFPDARVPIQSISTRKVNVPGHQNADAYMLDLDALTNEQREGIILVISTRFQTPIEEVRAEIGAGVPILAEGVTVSTWNQRGFFSLINDEED